MASMLSACAVADGQRCRVMCMSTLCSVSTLIGTCLVFGCQYALAMIAAV